MTSSEGTDRSGVSPGKAGVVAKIGGKAEGRAAPPRQTSWARRGARPRQTTAAQPRGARSLPSHCLLPALVSSPQEDRRASTSSCAARRPPRGRGGWPGLVRRAGRARRARGALPKPGPRRSPHACGSPASPPSAGPWKARAGRAGRRSAATGTPGAAVLTAIVGPGHGQPVHVLRRHGAALGPGLAERGAAVPLPARRVWRRRSRLSALSPLPAPAAPWPPPPPSAAAAEK